MTVDEAITLVKTNKFTCATGAQFLAEQPTKGEESHAHAHALDGFESDLSKIKPASFKAPSSMDAAVLAKSRSDFWKDGEVHLQPKVGGKHTGTIFDPTAPPKFEPYQFYVDETRLATNDTYLKRGMAEVAESNKTTFVQKMIYKEAGSTKPTNKDFVVTSATDTAHSQLPTGSTVTKALPVQTKVEKIHPTYPAMEAHSMFEDSEVLVMAVTAALSGDAGLFGLKKLKKGLPNTTYIAIFSASAVAAVNLAITKFAVKTKKTLDPMNTVFRSPATTSVKVASGLQPSLETQGAKYTKVEMKRVVAVIKKSATDELILVTCYPSQQPPPGQNLTPPPTATDDVVEMDKNLALYQIVKQATPVSLVWD